jgi:RNA polymerase sigma factor (sigma-70 family)
MTDPQRPLLDDPVVRRLQQAFADEEPATELAGVLRRAADYLAVDRHAAAPQPAMRSGLTAADLVAARQREPAAITRVYTAYAPSLFRFFMAAVGDRHEAQDLTGSVFASAIEALPGFRGPVQALGGWLFRIARHDLYDYRRNKARSPGQTPLEDHLDEAAAADTPTLQQALQAVAEGHDTTPPAALPQLVRRLAGFSGHATDAPLNRLSPRERQVLALLERRWSTAQIAQELFLSPYIVRTHLQNILQKLAMHAQLELAMQHARTSGLDDPEELSIEQLAGSRMIVALQQLPADQREVLLLRMAAGLTAPEVAAALHTTTGAVKALQHRALANLARRSRAEHPDATAAPTPSQPGRTYIPRRRSPIGPGRSRPPASTASEKPHSGPSGHGGEG